MKTNRHRVSVAVAVVLVCMGSVQANPIEESPLPPWGLTSTVTDSGIELAWNAPPDAVESYNVYRADSAEAVAVDGLEAFSLIGETTDLEFLDLDTELEIRGVYYVTATHSVQESPPSNLSGYPACLEVRPSCFWPPPLIGP